MWESDRIERRRTRWWLPVLVGLAVALAQITLVSRAWRDCGIDGATGLTTTSLYALGVPALTFLSAALVALSIEVFMHSEGSVVRRALFTVLSIAILIGAETLVLGHFVATPAEPVGTACIGNVPTWWPEWMPS